MLHGTERHEGHDVWVEISEENADRVYKGLAQFGAPLAGYTPKDFQDPYSGFQIGVPPSQIDIIFAVSGLTFEEAWPESIFTLTDEAIPVRYLSADHFIRNKTAAGRLQYQADVAAVLASRKANETGAKAMNRRGSPSNPMVWQRVHLSESSTSR